MTDFSEKVFIRNGCPIHYWIGGEDHQPWLVFLHGACVDHHSFDPLTVDLVNHYRILIWDARGHGLSQPMGQDFSVPLAVDDLLALMNLEGVDQPVLIGHSNGTYIAQELAFRHPLQLKAMVILDGTCITWPRSKMDEWLVKAGVAAFNWFPFETLIKSSVKYASEKKEVQDYAYRVYSLLSKHDFITIMKGVSLCLHSEPDYRVNVPLCILHGDHDRMGDILKNSPLWAKREPAMMYRVIPDAGHLATLDNPQFVLQALKEFLASVYSPSIQGENQ